MKSMVSTCKILFFLISGASIAVARKGEKSKSHSSAHLAAGAEEKGKHRGGDAAPSDGSKNESDVCDTIKIKLASTTAALEEFAKKKDDDKNKDALCEEKIKDIAKQKTEFPATEPRCAKQADAYKEEHTKFEAAVSKVEKFCGVAESSSCFAAQSLVQTAQGFVKMGDLKIGDEVATQVGFEPVLSFIHKSASPERFLKVEHSAGVLSLSRTHMVFRADGSSIPAAQLELGSILAGVKGPVVVKRISEEVLHGFVAPLTASGTIVVDGVVASQYVSPSVSFPISHAIAHVAMTPARWFSVGDALKAPVMDRLVATSA